MVLQTEKPNRREYIYYHPIADELFLLPIKPPEGFEEREMDLEVDGETLVMGFFYVGEL